MATEHQAEGGVEGVAGGAAGGAACGAACGAAGGETKVAAAGQKPEGCTAWEFTFGVEVQLKI